MIVQFEHPNGQGAKRMADVLDVAEHLHGWSKKPIRIKFRAHRRYLWTYGQDGAVHLHKHASPLDLAYLIADKSYWRIRGILPNKNWRNLKRAAQETESIQEILRASKETKEQARYQQTWRSVADSERGIQPERYEREIMVQDHNAIRAKRSYLNHAYDLKSSVRGKNLWIRIYKQALSLEKTWTDEEWIKLRPLVEICLTRL